MQLTLDPQIVARFRTGPVPVHFQQDGPRSCSLQVAFGGQGATHQVVMVLGKPLLTHLPTLDSLLSKGLQEQGFWEFTETQWLTA